MLDLFSGTGSVADVFRRHNYKVTTVDLDVKMQPDIVADILKWDYRVLPPGHYDIIFAAPPCTGYSQAMTSRPGDLKKADAIVRRTVEIIQYFNPRRLFIENPDTGLLKTRHIMDEFPSVRADYCQFSPWGRRKPTRV